MWTESRELSKFKIPRNSLYIKYFWEFSKPSFNTWKLFQTFVYGPYNMFHEKNIKQNSLHFLVRKITPKSGTLRPEIFLWRNYNFTDTFICNGHVIWTIFYGPIYTFRNGYDHLNLWSILKQQKIIIGPFNMDHIMDTICKIFHYSPNCTHWYYPTHFLPCCINVPWFR